MEMLYNVTYLPGKKMSYDQGYDRDVFEEDFEDQKSSPSLYWLFILAFVFFAIFICMKLKQSYAGNEDDDDNFVSNQLANSNRNALERNQILSSEFRNYEGENNVSSGRNQRDYSAPSYSSVVQNPTTSFQTNSSLNTSPTSLFPIQGTHQPRDAGLMTDSSLTPSSVVPPSHNQQFHSVCSLSAFPSTDSTIEPSNQHSSPRASQVLEPSASESGQDQSHDTLEDSSAQSQEICTDTIPLPPYRELPPPSYEEAIRLLNKNDGRK